MGTVIQSLYKEYFQKSRVFLYPALGIRRGVSVTPIETFMGWNGKFLVEDRKLCCLYHLRDDEDFRQFEKNKLLGNPLFFDFRQVEEKKAVYVFDFSQMADDWDAIVQGKYSKLSQKHKTLVRNYIGLNSPQLPYIDSFIYPERYFKLYAEMMDVDEALLRKVGELCSLPDFELEILDAKIEDLQLKFN